MDLHTPGPLPRDAVVWVAGHRGLAGGAVWRHLQAEGFTRLVGRSSTELDLRDAEATAAFVADQRPQVVVLAAAKVGGILANSTYPADFLSENLRIQLNVLDACLAHRVPRLLFLGSSCIYPRLAEQPIREDSLLTGPLEPTNDAYAIAKIAGVLHVQAVRRQHGLAWISAMPTNLYGPGDDFSESGSHVLPALVRRFSDAAARGDDEVVVWGSGTPRREFLHTDDLASALLHLLEHHDGPDPVNVGWGEDVSIAELAGAVARATGYTGRLTWDTSKPDGTPRKLLDTSTLRASGWEPQVRLDEGLRRTVAWLREHEATARL